MLRGFASRCLEPVSPRARTSPYRCAAAMWRDTVANSRRPFSERNRRGGDGRKKEWFEVRSAANQEEYFRKETARQLKEIRDRGTKRKAEPDRDIESDLREKTRRRNEPTADVPSTERE